MTMNLLEVLLGPALTAAVLTLAAKLIADLAEQRRRRRNIAVALLEEISINRAALIGSMTTDFSKLQAQIASDSQYRPYFAYDADANFLFSDHRKELPSLPRKLLKPVIDYYKQDAFLVRLLEDVRSSDFFQFSQTQRTSMLGFIDEGMRDTLAAADGAIAVLKRHLDGR
jgi:hypothetical protein